ncbi:transcriptional regulator [Streptomyces bauhiniae]
MRLLRLAEAGLLESVSRGVYLVTAAGMPRPQDIKAAWLRLMPKEFAWDRPAGHPDSGVVSHASACLLHELGDIPAPEVEISVPRRRTTTEPFVRLRTAVLEGNEATVVDGLPVTTPLRTITDLLRAKADGGHVGGVVAEAERRGLVDLDVLGETVQPCARKYGLKATATGRDLIDHLVAQAGESLRRYEIDRAGRDGFADAVHFLAARPDLAEHWARHVRPESLSGISKVLQDISRELAPARDPGNLALQGLSRPNPAVAAAIRRLAETDPELLAALLKPVRPARRMARDDDSDDSPRDADDSV